MAAAVRLRKRHPRSGQALLPIAFATVLAIRLLVRGGSAEIGFVGVFTPPARTGNTALGARRFLVGGNWKANGSPNDVRQLVQDLNAGRLSVDLAKQVEVVCAPPFPYLLDVKQSLRSDYAVGAQNMWDRQPGAWTGEVPGPMLRDLGVDWVILGHSERRQHCGETSEIVAAKTKFAIDIGLRTITCVGETLEEREAGETFNVLVTQMTPIAASLTKNDWDRVVLAYEPVWAIGTGAVATPEQAQEVHAFLRMWLQENTSGKVAVDTRILYGGSVNDRNSQELAALPDIDGFLVGGASLDGGKFTAIVNSAAASVAQSEKPQDRRDAGVRIDNVRAPL